MSRATFQQANMLLIKNLQNIVTTQEGKLNIRENFSLKLFAINIINQ